MAEKLPLVMIDRPKMPRATWDALRNHIVNARRKKKMELEQNAEVKTNINLTSIYTIKFSIQSTEYIVVKTL